MTRTEHALRIAIRGMVVLLLILFVRASLGPLERAVGVILNYPFQIDREDGFLLFQAMRLRAGESIYPPLTDFPFFVGNYTPVYPTLWAALLFVFEPSLAVGRGLVLAATLAAAGALAFLAWRIGRHPAIAAVGAGLFVATWEVNNWIVHARVDLPAIAFSLAGLAVLGLGAPRRWIPLAGVLFALGFLTKQTALCAPAAAVLALLLHRRVRDAASLAGCTALIAALPCLLLLALTRGEFWRHTVTYNANMLDWGTLTFWARHVQFMHLPKLLVALAVLAGVLALRRRCEAPGTHPYPLLLTVGLYLAFTALSLVSLAKQGSAENYLLEFLAALALFIASGLGRLQRWEGTLPAAVATVLTVLLFGATVWLVRPERRAIFFPPAPGAPELAMENLALLRVLEAPGEVHSDIPIYLLQARRPVLYQPFIMAQLAAEGRWQDAPMVQALEQRRFALVVSTENLKAGERALGWTAPMATALLQEYALSDVLPAPGGKTLFLYRPR